MGNFIGTLTIDRMELRTEMYTLYKNPDAVDVILEKSREVQSQRYFDKCSEKTVYEEPEVLLTKVDSEVMSLPCFREEDARTRVLQTIPSGVKVSVTGSIRNADGNKWYTVSYKGEEAYLFTGNTRPESWATKLREMIFG